MFLDLLKNNRIRALGPAEGLGRGMTCPFHGLPKGLSRPFLLMDGLTAAQIILGGYLSAASLDHGNLNRFPAAILSSMRTAWCCPKSLVNLRTLSRHHPTG
jgi:hypothetical protein